MKKVLSLFLSLILMLSVFQTAFPVFAIEYSFNSVVLSHSELTLNTDSGGKKQQALTLTYVDAENNEAEVTEDIALLWTSSDDKIAKVTNGTVTAVSNGECVITAKVFVDSMPTDISAQCNVTVRDSINKHYTTLQSAIDAIPADYETSGTYIGTTVEALKTAVDAINWNLEDTAENCAKVDEWTQAVVSATDGLKEHTTAIEITDYPAEVTVGGEDFTITYNVTGYDEVVWSSSDETVAKVDSTGKVTILGGCSDAANNTVTFTVTSNGFTDSCTVKINNPISKIELDKTEYNLYTGETGEIIATGLGKDENAPITHDYVFTWTSSDESVAVFENDGIKALKAGTTEITVKYNDEIFAVCVLVVTDPTPIASLEISEQPERVTAGFKTQASVTVSPDSATYPELEWTSSDENIAKVESKGAQGNVAYGEITGVSAGKATITYKTTDGTNLEGSFEIEVIPYSNIGFSEIKVTLNTDAGGKNQTSLTVVYLDDNGEVVEFTGESELTWATGDADIAIVENGMITAVANGTCDITATDKLTGKTAVCKLTVRDSINKYYADFEAVKATIPADYKDSTKYLSSAADAVDAVLGEYNGELEDTVKNCTVVAQLTASLQNAVNNLKDAEIAQATDEEFWSEWNEAYALMPGNKDAYLEESIAKLEEIALTVYGEDGNKIWLKKDKEALDQLADDFRQAFSELKPHTTVIQIVGAPEKKSVTDEPFTLSYEADGYDEVQWTSSNPDIASIDNNGTVTVHAGAPDANDPTVTFTVTSNGATASCKIIIINPLTSAVISQSSAVAFMGNTLQLGVITTGVDANAPATSEYEIRWTSNDRTIATVDENGVVTPQHTGQCLIQFSINSGEYKGTCTLTVKDPVPASILNKYDVPTKVTVGQSVAAKIEVLPTQVSFPELKWTSGNESIATVKSAGSEANIASGEITGVKEGTVTIYYETTDGTEISGSFEIEVTPDRDIVLSQDTLTLNLDGYGKTTATLTAMFSDINGTTDADSSVISWSTSAISVATVENGVVTAKKNGTCYIIVTDTVTGEKAQCEVTVRDTITTYYNKLKSAVEDIPADYNDETKYNKEAIENLESVLSLIDWTLTDSKENCDKVSEWKYNVDRYRIALVESEYASPDDIEFWSVWNEAYNTLPDDMTVYTDASANAVYAVVEEVYGVNYDKVWLKVDKEKLDALAEEFLNAVANLKVRTTAVEITSSPLQWKVGDESFKIEYSVTGYDEIHWSVSDDSVLTVENATDENGNAYGKATVIGGCPDASNPYVTVTVTSGEYSDSCQIKIINPVASIKIARDGLERDGFNLYTNETAQLEIIKIGVDPDNPVTEDTTYTAVWSSNKENIAAVSQTGLVTPVSAGTMCKITAVYGEFEASCMVTVSKHIAISKLTQISVPSRVTVNATTSAAVIITPNNATMKNIEWSSSDESIVKVVSNGTDAAAYATAAVTGVSEGKATITYRTTDGTNIEGSFTVTVDPLVSSVTLDKHAMSVYIGDTESTHKLTATVLPENAGNQVLTWVSSNENVAKVVNGKIEVLSVGTTTISAHTMDGTTFYDECLLTVVGDAKDMTISQTSGKLKVGQTLQLSSEVTTNEGATYTDVTWSSSDTSKAIVSEDGKVLAKLPGTVTITAKSYDGTTRTCTVTITADLFGISLPETMTLAIGRSKTVTPSYDPSYATNKNVTWRTSNASVVSVSSSGKITANSVGTAMITATSEEGGYVAFCKVNVVRPVTSLSINRTSYSLTMGSKTTVKITATVNPSNATNKSVKWTSSNAKVATVDQKGNVKAVGPGTAKITVTTIDGGYSRTCKITVIQPVTGVKFSSSKMEMYVSQSKTFSYSVLPSNATDDGVTFKSSNTKVATVDSKGKVKAKKTGKCTIYVTTDDGEYTAKCKVTVVKKVDVKKVKLNYSSVTVDKGKTLTLKPTISPSNASNKSVTWKSSDTSVATVNSKGVVTGKKGGTVTITCTTKDKKKTATCEVTIYEAVTSLKLSASSMTLATGKSMTLKATVTPSTATNTSVKWSSANESIATVSSKGKVTAKKTGSVTITAKSKDNGKIVAKCVVTVVQSPTKISLSDTELSIRTGGRANLTATVSPASSHDKTVTWYSNKPSVAKVSDSGVVTGMKAGTATITCTSSANPKVKKSCVVTVTEPVLGVTLSSKSLTMTTGRTKTLVAKITPENATNQAVTWKSSDRSVAEVNKKGRVEAVGPGEATITCTTKDGLYIAKCKVTVLQPVISVRLNKTSTTISIGDTKQLKATIKPSDATNQEVTWRSSNSKIARVTQSGRVTALKEGTVKITCTTEDGGLVAVCVVQCVIPVEGVSLNKTSVTLKKGRTTTLKAKIYPTDATIQTVKWSSSNKKVVTVDKNGKLKAVGKGTATITCKTKNGGYKITCKVKVK